MKKIENKKGFTLIELLAVIVVLAIVMVLAVTTVLPLIEKARKNALATEANAAVAGAYNAISLIKLGVETGYGYGSDGSYCFTVDNLSTLGVLDKKNNSLKGTVIAHPSNNTFNYDVSISNGSFHYNKSAVTEVDGDDVTSGDGNVKTSCN